MEDVLLHGDCLVELRKLADNSVDSLVCDPPAGISFMNKEFDHDKGGRTQWIAWLSSIMREALRVLKPGAHGLVWSLPRTSHWTATALEDAGFEIRDSIYHLYSKHEKLQSFMAGLSDEQRAVFEQLMEDDPVKLHVFGCLSEDTEILTSEGWVQYQTVVAGHLALCYNLSSGTLGWEPVKEVLTYDYDDTAFHIKSDHTDQIVSRNHRCIVERSGKYLFKEAESLECYESVPVLEDLRGVLESLSLPRQSGGRKAGDMFTSLQGQVRSDTTREGSAEKDTRQYKISLSDEEKLRSLSSSVPMYKPLSSGTQQDMLQGLSRCATEPQTQGYNSCTSRARNDMRDVRKEVCSETLETEQEASKVLLRQMLRAMESQRSRHTCSVSEDSRNRTGGLVGGNQGSIQIQDHGSQQPSLEGRRNDLQETRQLYGSSLCEMSPGISSDVTQGRICDGASFDCSANHRASTAESRGGTSYQPRPNGQPDREPATLCEQSGSQTIRASRYTRSDLASVTPIHYKGVVWCVRVPSGAFVARRNGKVFITGNSGFPKSHDISKSIDRHFKAEREVIGFKRHARDGDVSHQAWTKKDTMMNTVGNWGYARDETKMLETAPATDLAKKFAGFGSALKPSCETWWLIRKPLSEKSIAENVMKWGTAGLNIDACRVEVSKNDIAAIKGSTRGKIADDNTYRLGLKHDKPLPVEYHKQGRWPSHLLLSHSIFCTDTACSQDCPVALMDEQSGVRTSGGGNKASKTGTSIWGNGKNQKDSFYDVNQGGASRYFQQFRPADDPPFIYAAKASRRERNAGCEELPEKKRSATNFDGAGGVQYRIGEDGKVTPKAIPAPEGNNHPTVKSQALMKWLITLVTPPGGVVLDCFAGSGSTLVAAIETDHHYIGVEKEAEYIKIIQARLDYAYKQKVGA